MIITAPEQSNEMVETDYLGDLKRCELCEQRCMVNRLEGETGVSKVTLNVATHNSME
jgi:uncharacterized Fe-S radical SAM superfamily protein PflX